MLSGRKTLDAPEMRKRQNVWKGRGRRNITGGNLYGTAGYTWMILVNLGKISHEIVQA